MKFFFRIKEDSSEYINMISIGNVKIVTNKINVVATENAPEHIKEIHQVTFRTYPGGTEVVLNDQLAKEFVDNFALLKIN
jgi:translation initiation factor 2 gamma subunit (eIF-2gamma)